MTGDGSLPTMKDVAREAQVALGTVSKVFNDIPVGDSYRQRVLEAANRLGYQVNSYARGLKTNKTNTVALVVPNIDHPFFATFTQNVCKTLYRRGNRMMLAITDYDPAVEQECFQMARLNRLDGIIGMTYNPALVIDDTISYVSFDRYFNPKVPCVSSDNFGGGQMAAAKLAELGAKNLLFLRTGSTVQSESDKRGDGFEFYCKTNGIPFQSLRLQDEEDPRPIFSFLRENLTDGHLPFDGIFCSTDGLALDIWRELVSLGIRVPEEVQIIGFDGIPVWGFGGIPCSSIVQPIAQLAETCVDIVLKPKRSELPSLICLPVSYARGGTTRG